MTKSELLARLMMCDARHLEGRSLSALATQIETRAKGSERAIESELTRLGYNGTPIHGQAVRGRA